MKPYNYQVEIADEALTILRKNYAVYLAMEERTGKTLTSIVLAERTNMTNILVLTKKKALDGWIDTLDKYKGDGETEFTVTNYHQAGKLKGNYDLVILDECFVGNTLVDGKAIRDYRVGDYVTTTNGPRRIYATHCNESPEELCEVVIGGKKIVCTPDHLFKTSNRGWIKIKEATSEDEFITS